MHCSSRHLCIQLGCCASAVADLTGVSLVCSQPTVQSNALQQAALVHSTRGVRECGSAVSVLTDVCYLCTAHNAEQCIVAAGMCAFDSALLRVCRR
jgi:hypothetical protein